MNRIRKFFPQRPMFASVLVTSFFVGAISGGFFGAVTATLLADPLGQLAQNRSGKENGLDLKAVENSSTDAGSETVVAAVRRVRPAVVSIVIKKDVPKMSNGTSPFQNPLGSDDLFRQFFGVPNSSEPVETEKQQVGGGTGFFVTADGLILTNRHVVSDEAAEYSVLMNDGKELPAVVVARDSVNDLAIIKVEGKDFPVAAFGDSSSLELGQTVVAIGNALGEFRNTVSVGVISGLARSITADGAPTGPEQLFNVLQTDAAINAGNSGGPLINLKGEVIGVNTAVASQGQNIGFAIPANDVRQVVDGVKRNGKIVRPFLGVRYVLITPELAEDEQLPVTYGALVVRGNVASEVAVTPGSPADKAGIKENDIILSINNQKITSDNPLSQLIASYQVGSSVPLTVLQQGKEQELTVVLIERK